MTFTPLKPWVMVQAQAPFLCVIWHHDALGMVDQAQAIIAGTGAKTGTKEDMITLTSSPGFWGEEVTPLSLLSGACTRARHADGASMTRCNGDRSTTSTSTAAST